MNYRAAAEAAADVIRRIFGVRLDAAELPQHIQVLDGILHDTWPSAPDEVLVIRMSSGEHGLASFRLPDGRFFMATTTGHCIYMAPLGSVRLLAGGTCGEEAVAKVVDAFRTCQLVKESRGEAVGAAVEARLYRCDDAEERVKWIFAV